MVNKQGNLCWCCVLVWFALYNTFSSLMLHVDLVALCLHTLPHDLLAWLDWVSLTGSEAVMLIGLHSRCVLFLLAGQGTVCFAVDWQSFPIELHLSIIRIRYVEHLFVEIQLLSRFVLQLSCLLVSSHPYILISLLSTVTLMLTSSLYSPLTLYQELI